MTREVALALANGGTRHREVGGQGWMYFDSFVTSMDASGKFCLQVTPILISLFTD